MSKNVSLERQQVYLMTDGRKIKIGRALDIRARVKQLQCGNGNTIKPLYSARLGSFSCSVETALHRKFAGVRCAGEWFSIDESTALAALVCFAMSYVGVRFTSYSDACHSRLLSAVQAEKEIRWKRPLKS